mgnify:FL=1
MMCSPHYNRRVTNKKTMFDSKLQPLYDGQVLVNEQAKKDAVVLAALHAMAQRQFKPQEINRHGVWYISDRH